MVSTDVVLAQDFPHLAQQYRVESVPLAVIESAGAVRTVLGARPESFFRDALVSADREGAADA